MNTITRLFIAPLLVLCLAVLGCAVFPGQHQDTTSPKQKETAATNIVLPANDQSSGVQPDPSSDQSVDAVFRGLPPLTSETFDARLATEQNRLRNSTVTPQQYQPENSRLATQNQSLVPKELYSNRATIKPTPNEKVFQANRIEFAADKVPFGNGLQTTSHSAVEPIATPSPVDDAVKDATMSISDVVPSPPEAGTISWPIDDFSPTPIPIRSNSIRLNFLVPDPVNEEAAKKLKLLIDVDGKYFNRDDAESIDLSDQAQVTTFKFKTGFVDTDKIKVTFNKMPEKTIEIVDGKTTPAEVVATLVAALNDESMPDEFKLVTWSVDETDETKETLKAAAKSPAKAFKIEVVATDNGGTVKDIIGAKTAVSTARGDEETNKLFDAGLNAVTLNGLPEGETVEIKVWIEKQITKKTPKELTFRSFKVTTPTRDPEAPVITRVANTEYVTPGDVPALLKLFYDKPFIRLEGTHGTSERGELTFILRDAAGEPVSAKIENLKVDPINEAQRTWKAEFNLSEKLEGDGRLFVLRKQGNKHNYSPTPLKFQTIEPTGAALSDTISIKVNKPGGAAAELKDNEVFLTNQTEVVLSGPKSGQPIPAEFAIVATTKGGKTYLNSTQGAGDGAWDFSVKGLKEGRQDIVVDLMLGQKFQGVSTTIPIFVRTEGPRIISVEPSNFGTAPGVSAMTIKFDPNNPLSADTWDLFKDKTGLETVFSIYGSNGTGVFTGAQSPVPSPLSTTSTVTLNKPGHAITLMFNRASLPADIYQLQVKGELIEDVYGNLLVGDDGEKGTLYTKILGGDGISASGGLASKFKADDTPTINPAIGDSTGEFVAYPEFVRRPDVPDGFNPNDKVETRVVRLYYYRDAHRIAQIVNRKVQSYNRAAVKTNRQLADKARNQANQLTVQRQNSERNAIILAGKTRQQENELQQAENSLNGSLQQLTNYRREKGNVDLSDDAMNKQLESLVNSFGRQVTELRGRVQESRDQEVQANELTQQAEAQEKLAREDQFRREVAAAHSDPDTYAPGKINSVDPVEQVSVSVVGEGMIQLRGPLKGINLIRTAIDQLDSPVGQVRISLHTIQINGERADRMEVVAKEVQTYIDHARFLTMQSSEMLRKAVVQVASQKAEEASGLYPGSTQMDRDERYIVAFFGKDFIDELKAMDSEFLHTGNKLLSLHSMDTTSLASALNLMALAKNSTRQDIFATFDSMLQTQLPQAEQNYFAAGWTCPKKKKHNLFHRCKDCQPEFCPMACNARFESLRGFFDMQISNDDTMTPLQREFIRLAQIFKSRLVTEMEYKQRVMERALIEERLGNRKVELQAAIDKEDAANEELEKMQEATVKGRVNMIRLIKEIEHGVQFGVESEFTGATGRSSFFKKMASLKEPEGTDSATWNNRTIDFKLEEKRNYYTFDDQESVDFVKREYDALLENMRYIHSVLQLLATIQGETKFKDDLDDLNEYILDMETDGLRQRSATQFSVGQLDVQFIVTVDELLAKMSDPFTGARNVLLNGLSDLLSKKLTEMLSNLSSEKSADIDRAYASWLSLKKLIRPLLQTIRDPVVKTELNTKVNSVEKGFSDLFGNGFLLARAESQATKSRRPLDHKKFLDMLVDDLEEKYIELLDGTRAHVANIDNYLKRVTTALDDDFNTQFYYPAFKYIRESSVSYDVQFGQFETTTLLANNREFAKADPSASMEFDLPERDILIAEGLNGAKAMMSDIGALANDPTFLAMTKLNGPGSTASFNRGASGGNGVVRNVLPGLGSNTSEQVMSQNSNGGQQFGSNLENLIPDPAVYKFETGTGFEIRPVIQPDGQAVVFDFNYMYTTEIREPVRADEKHLGRVKRHFVDTDVQLSNFELREVSRYTVALKAARTAKGVPLFEDIPGVGVLFRPLPSDENSLQQNLIMAQATIFPTLFDLMGLRWASVVSDLDPLTLSTSDFVVRNRHRMLENRVYDESSSYVDEFLRVPESERRMDLYRSQESVPYVHPNGYAGPGMNVRDSQMQEGYQPNRVYPAQPFVPHQSIEGSPNRSQRRPSDEWYYQNRSSAPPNPNGIREPGAVNPERGR